MCRRIEAAPVIVLQQLWILLFKQALVEALKALSLVGPLKTEELLLTGTC